MGTPRSLLSTAAATLLPYHESLTHGRGRKLHNFLFIYFSLEQRYQMSINIYDKSDMYYRIQYMKLCLLTDLLLQRFPTHGPRSTCGPTMAYYCATERSSKVEVRGASRVVTECRK
ncbi:hypothetical protein AVEN_242180-1 [Araneus ventricosus]|uniref:Uncharacterized protein n=1 Tax=Araneus ventricosus TaxID=182803 RepID=A0A4Y2DEB9_ARAVE|nr:hypothetical protein AVEN_242180-1 [Araneus ventricosus]